MKNLGEDLFDNVEIVRRSAIDIVRISNERALGVAPVLNDERQPREWMATVFVELCTSAQKIADDPAVNQEVLASTLIVWLLTQSGKAHDLDIPDILQQHRPISRLVTVLLFAFFLDENERAMQRFASGD